MYKSGILILLSVVLFFSCKENPVKSWHRLFSKSKMANINNLGSGSKPPSALEKAQKAFLQGDINTSGGGPPPKAPHKIKHKKHSEHIWDGKESFVIFQRK